MTEVRRYICDTCKKVFDSKMECKDHEAICKPCNKCKHCYYVYGVTARCDYEDKGQCSDFFHDSEYKACFESK